jgi:hypothetical protein
LCACQYNLPLSLFYFLCACQYNLPLADLFGTFNVYILL